MKAAALSAAFAAMAALAGCRTDQTLVTPDPHLERMLDQPKTKAYEATPLLPGDMAMQPPPEGAVPASVPGAPGGALDTLEPPVSKTAERVPVAVDHALLETGRARFETFCATCHGVLGDGVSAVADQMALRKPTNLVTLSGEDLLPGSVFYTVRHGYGLMPSYAVQLSVRDTWAVVAYVSALQLARHAKAADLPPDVREQLAKEAP